MTKLVFDDKNEFQGQTHYPVANESVRRWREVLKDVKVKVGGAIAGGGEISFFGILPSITERLVCVDHSYVSLWALLGKYHVIETLGPEKAIKLLQTPPPTNRLVGAGYDAAGNRVADGKYNQYGELMDRNPYSHLIQDKYEELYSCFLAGNKGRITETDRMEECGWWPLPEMALRWSEITSEDCQALLDTKTELQVYHGDISDLAEYGPVDLLYLSNALQYNGRAGRAFKLDEITQKGSLVCWTGPPSSLDSYSRPRTASAKLTVGNITVKPVEVIKPKKTGTRSSAPSTAVNQITYAPLSPLDGSWTYSLAEVC